MFISFVFGFQIAQRWILAEVHTFPSVVQQFARCAALAYDLRLWSLVVFGFGYGGDVLLLIHMLHIPLASIFDPIPYKNCRHADTQCLPVAVRHSTCQPGHPACYPAQIAPWTHRNGWR